MPKAKASKTTSDSSGGGWSEKAHKIGKTKWPFRKRLEEGKIPGFKAFEDSNERGFTWTNKGDTTREVLQTRSGPSDIWVDVRSKARKKKK